jgi:hypothetical protein
MPMSESDKPEAQIHPLMNGQNEVPATLQEPLCPLIDITTHLIHFLSAVLQQSPLSIFSSTYRFCYKSPCHLLSVLKTVISVYVQLGLYCCISGDSIFHFK